MLKKLLAFLLFSSLITLQTSLLLASEINLPRTGQTLCYNESGTTISCSGTGQDGNIQAGQPFPSPRFTTNGNGTVADNLTGLVWLQNANCNAVLGGVDNTYGSLTWAQALAWSNALASGYCGLTDGSTVGQWRLPTRLELESLTDASKYSPALPTGHPFSNVQSKYYWTSTTSADSTYQAFYIYMATGSITRGNKTNYVDYYVWPVRGGQ